MVRSHRARGRHDARARDLGAVSATQAAHLYIDAVLGHFERLRDRDLNRIHPLAGRVHVHAVFDGHAHAAVGLHCVVVLAADGERTFNDLRGIFASCRAERTECIVWLVVSLNVLFKRNCFRCHS